MPTSPYLRPGAAATLPHSHWPMHTQCDRALASCSEQVHIQLGGDHEMVVVWATLDGTVPSTVEFWEAKATESTASTATGLVDVYSQLQFLNDWLTSPPMGNATTTDEAVLAMLNTSGWAVDPQTGEHTSSWADPTTVKWFQLGPYQNPAFTYNSPYIHTATLSPLKEGVSYRYRVAGDSRVFDFTMPPAAGPTYPLLLGLVSDVGQTAVSEESFVRLRAMAPHAVLLAGDLAYADNWGSRWDSYIAVRVEPEIAWACACTRD